MLLLMLTTINSSAQSYSSLELVENKGQWNEQVKFKGALGNGAFFLQPQGYKLLLHNKEDLERLAEITHGHPHKKDEPSLAVKQATHPKLPQEEKLILHSHAYEMKFLGSTANAQIIPEKPFNSYNNYFIGNNPSQWASDCKIYQAVTYKNVYPGIDVRYYSENGRLKYDIIVNPGASPEKIMMHFDGADGIEVKNDNLVIKTSVEEVKELKPYSYQAGTVGRKEIGNKYELSGNVVKFRLGAYDKTKTLVIDPTLVFSTFSGSKVDNWGYTATYDAGGNFYGGGIVFGNQFPVSNGAFQTTFQNGVQEGTTGAHDVAIIKFSPDGANRIYATYLGGGNNEQPHSLVVDGDGNLIVAGRTASTTGTVLFPTNLPTFGPGGGTDIFITKLNASGTGIVASRRFGGTGIDGINIRAKSVNPTGAVSIRRNYGDDARSEVIVDESGNIYLASCTQSNDDYPTTPNAFQKSFGGGLQDGVFIKTSPDINTVITSSYIGGGGDDAAFVLALNPSNGNIYIAGGTTSNNLNGITPPAINTGYQGGGADGFVSILNNNGDALIKTTYIGTSGIDIVYGIQFDKFGFPYIMGTTTGTWAAINAAFSMPGGKQFIAKLQPDLSAYVYSTMFGKGGGSPDISPVAFLVDRCENVYVSGWGGIINSTGNYPSAGTNNLPVTPNALQSQSDGSDFYYFVLARNASSQLYGSFFGALNGNLGDHVDGGTSRFDRNGVIYQAQCGFCQGGPNPFPTTPGVWSPLNQALGSGGGGECNLAAVKISFDLAGVGAHIKSSVEGRATTKGCVPFTVDFTDTIALGQRYVWNFGDGSPDTITLPPTVSHTYTAIGQYQVRLVSIDSNACNIADTSYTVINVRVDEAKLSFSKQKLPPCENLTYRFINTSTPPAAPGKPFGNQSFRWHFGDGQTQIAGPGSVDHTYPSLGTYEVRLELIDTNYCNYPNDLVDTLRLAENVKARFTTTPFGCVPYNAVFVNTSEGGQQFIWNFGDGTTSNQENPAHTYIAAGTYTIRLTIVDSATCNIIDSTIYSITVSDAPTAAFDYSPVPPQVNTPVTFTNNSAGGTAYLWAFGDGDTLYTIKRDTLVSHEYNSTATFNSCLTVYNSFGCTDTICKPINARIIPAMDVPNAFTPNNDGVNDKIYVRGFGIARMTWRIYNRWGQMVFQTNNRHEGWDGRFKGVLQPQEVYHYTLDLEFSDGKKETRTGDITLLR